MFQPIRRASMSFIHSRPVWRSNPALFLCDIQERFRSTIHQFPAVVETAQHMIEAGNILNIPLIVTEQYPKALGKTVKELSVGHAELYVEKTQFSMCTDQVSRWLTDHNKNAVFLFGIESHVCVLNTALDLRRLGIDVYVVADGVSSSNQAEIKIALERMRQEGCFISTSESLLFELMHDASHPQFKFISALVKKMQTAPWHNKLLNDVGSRL